MSQSMERVQWGEKWLKRFTSPNFRKKHIFTQSSKQTVSMEEAPNPFTSNGGKRSSERTTNYVHIHCTVVKRQTSDTKQTADLCYSRWFPGTLSGSSSGRGGVGGATCSATVPPHPSQHHP